MGWNCPVRDVVRVMSISHDQYYRCKKELLQGGWIRTKRDYVIPVRGFEHELQHGDNHSQRSRINPTLGGSESSEKSNSELEKSDYELEKSDSHIRKTSSFNQLTQPISRQLEPAEMVFEFWLQTFNKRPGTKFGPKRRKAVLARLNDGYTVDDLKSAVLGCSITPYNMGSNENLTVYNDLELICRDETKVDRFLATWEAHNARTGQVCESTAAVLCDFCRDHGGRVLVDIGGDKVSVSCTHGCEAKAASASL
jgi:hypothetical protein